MLPTINTDDDLKAIKTFIKFFKEDEGLLMLSFAASYKCRLQLQQL
jgi:hypothetical protein